jgi:glycosyltransferase involved in cell wall biosynthesis
MPLVTVVIPTYNYGEYLSDAIESALKQTYKNLEVIVIDDGSSDNTEEIVKRYDGRLSYYFKENGGISSARNYGMLKAKGEYIVFLDSDDKLHESYVERTLAHLQKHSAHVDFVYTQQQFFEASGRGTQLRAYNAQHIMKENILPANHLIKTSVAKQFTYDVRFKVLEDWDFYLTLAENGFVGSLLDEPMYFYRIHSDRNSTMDKTKLRDVLRTRHRVMVKHRKFYGVYRTAIFQVRYYGRELLFVLQALKGTVESGLNPSG